MPPLPPRRCKHLARAISNNKLKNPSPLTGDNFPSTEAFITDPSGQALFIGVGQIKKGTNPNTGPVQLFGRNEKNPVTSFSFTINTDNKGNFTGVKEGETTYSIDDWNKRFEQKKPITK